MTERSAPIFNDPGYALRVTAYDRAVSAIISCLILLGICVLGLFIIWLTGRSHISQVAVPVSYQPIGEGGLPLGPEMEINTEPPGQEEELEEPELQDALASVADVVAARLADLENPLVADPECTERGGPKGSPVRSGAGGTGGSGVPRRWEIFFDKGNTLDTYARQLDYFKIELGVLLPGNKVQYASGFSQPQPRVRIGPADAEKRFYLTWQRGDLQEADKQLLAKAGIDADNRIILKFLPPEVEAQLAALERAHAGSRADRVSSTRFGIRREGSGFAFYVISQQYR
ncbi:MAG: hypothetical protein KatS3mg112_1443 [Thermogutta sp.]|nr:MAG: hypothetical protein KatS3mg112_1443 [Thermogutta sp.]